jgi:membrane protease YdiL (CAAX protease family)
MSRFKQFATRHPIAFAVVIALTFMVLTVAAYAFAVPLSALFPSDARGQQISEALTRAALALLFILLLWRFGWLRAAGFARWPKWTVWLLWLPAVVYEVATGVYAYTGDPRIALPASTLTAAVLFNQLTVGLVEETAFRGIVMYAMLRRWGNTKHGIVNSVLLSAILFGALHALNLATGKPVLPTLLQCLGACLGGITYGAFVLYGKSIWPAVLWHALLNAAVNVKVIGEPMYAETPSMGVLHVLLNLPVVVYGLLLLRKVPLQPVVPEAD